MTKIMYSTMLHHSPPGRMTQNGSCRGEGRVKIRSVTAKDARRGAEISSFGAGCSEQRRPFNARGSHVLVQGCVSPCDFQHRPAQAIVSYSTQHPPGSCTG